MTTPASRAQVFNTEDFNFGWHFVLEDGADFSTADHDDSDWRQLRLPHDWSIEFPYDPVDGDGATAYLPGGIGWYRKRFAVDPGDDQLAFVLFDGIYNNSEVWLNGQPLGQNPYGYSPFWFDLTPALRPGDQEQVLAVRVDHSRYVDSRWYTGSGIYRDVKLITKSRLHIPIWGTRITTPDISETSASVEIEIAVKNAFAGSRSCTLRTVFLDADGIEVATAEDSLVLAAGDESRFVQSADVAEPSLWSPEHPYLYRAVTILQSGDELNEVYETPFGIRSFHFDPDEGFFLNGENALIKGVCLHHDGGLVGAAVPDGVWRRRLATLKDLGCNAIRTAHNPSSAAFLDLCDEMGFLVQLEFFDEWDEPKDKRLNLHERHDDAISRGYAEHYEQWGESDLKRTMLRDRNHPCIFQWSIGNEIEWAYTRYAGATGYFDQENQINFFWSQPPNSADEIKQRFEASPEGDHVLSENARDLARWTREMDESRPVVANCVLPSVSHVTGFTDVLDVVGYSYRQVIYDLSHELYPDKVIMGCENLGQWHEWKHVIERPFISGIFIWTGIHYLGEAHDRWPSKGSAAGLLDFAGFTNGSGQMFKTLWRDDPQVHLTTQAMDRSLYKIDKEGVIVEREPGGWKQRIWQWQDVNEHWNYETDAKTAVEVYSNCAEVELSLNGESLGSQKLADQEDRIFKWAVPFEAGTLEARGLVNGQAEAIAQLVTAGEPAAIQLSVDRDSLLADGYDVAHLIAQLVDVNGVPVRHVEREIIFSVNGPCRVLGVDNGAVDSVQPYQSKRVLTSQGRALLIVQTEQTERAEGTISVSAASDALNSPVAGIRVGEKR